MGSGVLDEVLRFREVAGWVELEFLFRVVCF